MDRGEQLEEGLVGDVLQVLTGEDKDELLPLNLTEQDPELVLEILEKEKGKLELWHQLAMYFYRKGQVDDFKRTLMTLTDNEQLMDEAARGSGSEYRVMKIKVLTTLAAYYLKCASECGVGKAEDEKREQFAALAETLHNKADRMSMTDQSNLVGKGFLYFTKGQLTKADEMLQYILAKSVGGERHIPALLGKACIDFSQGKYADALDKYRKVLQINPGCPPAVRVGIGMCYARLKKPDKAIQAFDRAIELDPGNSTAMVGRAVLELNKKTPESVDVGVKLLTKAYEHDKSNSMVQNHLADHLFFRRDEDHPKVVWLANNALTTSTHNGVQAEGHYHIARVHHKRGEHDVAFKHYYAASKQAPKFVLPHYGLGQIYIHKGDRTKAQECFEKVHKEYPDNYETLKILGSLYGRSEHPKNREKGATFLRKVTEMRPEDVFAWLELASLEERIDKVAAIKSYETVLKIFESIPDAVPPPEILNNLGCLYMQVGRLADADEKLRRAAEDCAASDDAEANDYIESIAVSIRYNQGLLLEKGHHTEVLPRVFRVTKGYPEIPAGTPVTVVGDAGPAVPTYTVALRDGPDGEGVLGMGGGRMDSTQAIVSRDDLEEIQPCATALFAELAEEHPKYVDCHMRLSEMARDRGGYAEALEHVKHALEGDKRDPDVWTAWGNIHLAKKEVQNAQKKFEQVLEEAKVKDDPYALLALGNIWLAEAQSARSIANPDAQKRAIKYAKLNFRSVLKKEPRNVFAAHGIGCVLAVEGRLSEAKDVFVSVREAESDIPEPWLNLAHVYLDQKNYVNAIKLYENTLKRFYFDHNVEIMQFLAKAYFRAGKYEEARLTLMKALHICPEDNQLRYNLASATLAGADAILRQDDYALHDVERAVGMLRDSRRIFAYLETMKSTRFSKEQAGRQQKRCNDYLQQAKRSLESAKHKESEKRAEQDKVELKRREFEASLKAKKEMAEQKRTAELEEKLARIARLQEQISEQKLLDIEIERKGPARKRKKKRDDGVIVDDEDGPLPLSVSLDDGGAAEETDKTSKKGAGRKRKKKFNPKEKSEEYVPDEWDESNPMSESEKDPENEGSASTAEPKRRKLQRDASSDEEVDEKEGDGGAPQVSESDNAGPATSSRMILDDDEDE